MTLLLSVPEFLSQHPDIESQIEAMRSPWTIPLHDPTGRSHGYRQEVNLRTGLTLLIDDYTLTEELIVETESDDTEEPCLELEMSFMLSGQNQLENVRSRHNFIEAAWHDSADGHFHWRSGERVLKLDIHIDSALFASLVGDNCSDLPDSLRQIVQDPEAFQPSFRQVSLTTAAMQTAIHQIFYCPYEGVTRWLYLECKVLELIALRLEQIRDCSPPPPEKLSGLKTDDVERIYYVREILRSQLVNPPALQELAHLAGLNDCKLKKGFRQTFGTTVFGYVTQQRMERACQLLAQQQSVAAVAAAVGYASPTAFSSAFQRRFSTSPKAYQVAQRGYST
ncbi:MAG: AraC family transcriptional regulator [Cyanobacteria bacterium J06649_4]